MPSSRRSSGTAVASTAGSPMASALDLTKPTEKGPSASSTTSPVHSERTGDPEKAVGADEVEDPTSAPQRLRTHESGFEGTGTPEDPFRVAFRPHDRDNPMAFKPFKRWGIVFITAMSTLAISFASSAVTGALPGVIAQFACSEEVATLSIALFVLGFALGPLLWAPLSEMYGRKLSFIVSYAPFVILSLGAGFSKNVATLIILRFLAGAFGSSPLTNSGGPVLGPVCGNFLGVAMGWRAVLFMVSIFGAVMFVLQTVLVPETFAPVLLRRKARELSKRTGRCYVAASDFGQPRRTVTQRFQTSLTVPFKLLFREPIVILISLYMALIYGILYLMFAAVPITFQQYRGWSAGIAGLAFVPIGIGMLIGAAIALAFDARYGRICDANDGLAPPEARLPMGALGAWFLPIGLLIFALTGDRGHWTGPIIGSAPFGAGMMLLFLSLMNFIVDAYTRNAASALAASAVIRSFPLFTRQMYARLGLTGAGCLIAGLALVFAPIPLLFIRYGEAIRKRSRYAPEDLWAKRQRELAEKSQTA